jgi:V/A-type H+/Na+-transporting ATPase subunit K
MEPLTMEPLTLDPFWGQLSLALAFGMGAMGSALGIGAAGQAAAGAWAKEAREGRPLSFTYVILLGMPLSQTLYGFILMLIGLAPRVADPAIAAGSGGMLLSVALGGGIALLFSAWMQGKIAAAACRALSEADGQGLAFMIIALGIAETTGLFGFVFLLMVLP